jgi:alanyl-tRNA synthetase
MNADRQARSATPGARATPRARERLGRTARRWLLRAFPPYARYSVRQASTAAALERLERDFEHIRKRHTEQIERLEDLVRELVATAESLRRELACKANAHAGDEGD